MSSGAISTGIQGAYLHIPFCRRRCYYCDFPISVVGDRPSLETYAPIQDYVDLLCREIKLAPKPDHALNTIFFGGGTPSLLPIAALTQILEALDRQLGISPKAEISMEIDPGTFDRDQLLGFLQAGINRFSLGVQAFQEELLQVCGRSHILSDTYQAIALFQELGIKNFSFDLISGLPTQTLEQWQNSLAQAIALRPPHISCYDLVLEPVTAFGKRYQAGASPLPTDRLTAEMYRMAQQVLTEAGYGHYEISNYALHGHQCRHNRLYWENRPYYGFGMGAASYTQGKRINRPRNRQGYREWVVNLEKIQGVVEIPEEITQETMGDRLLETIMLGLRLAEGLSVRELIHEFGQEVVKKIAQTLFSFEKSGWIEARSATHHLLSLRQSLNEIERINLSDPEGFLFSNTVLASLFEVFAED
jgi:oxygen-independent coproporphyrinogen-3 oxidase